MVIRIRVFCSLATKIIRALRAATTVWLKQPRWQQRGARRSRCTLIRAEDLSGPKDDQIVKPFSNG